MSNQDPSKPAEIWLSAHAPRPELSAIPHSLARLFDSMPGGVQVAAVPSGALVGGSAVNYKDADAAITAAGSDVGKLTEILTNNPITGCTTVMDIALKHSGYNPLHPNQAGNFAAYLKYVQAIATAPFFHLSFADTKIITETSSDFDILLNGIADLFESITSEDKARIVKDLKHLAHSATSTKDQEESTNVFTQSAIAQNTDEITVAIYNSSVTMIEHSGKHTTSQTRYQINRSLLVFRQAEWPVFAPLVARRQVKRVEDWLNDNNSA